MKTFNKYLLLFLLTIHFSSCTLVQGVFKAGMAWGVIVVVGIVAIIFFLISRASGKK